MANPLTRIELCDLIDCLVLEDANLETAKHRFVIEASMSRGTGNTFNMATIAVDARQDRLAILRSKLRAMLREAPDA